MEFLQWLHLGSIAVLIATIAWMAARIGGVVRYDRYPTSHTRAR